MDLDKSIDNLLTVVKDEINDFISDNSLDKKTAADLVNIYLPYIIHEWLGNSYNLLWDSENE